MATGTAGEGNGQLTDLLDSCLDRLRQGEGLERCLQDNAGHAGELEPLLRTASALLRARVAPPTSALACGRDRFLAAAGVRRAEVDARQAVAAARLDAVIERQLRPAREAAPDGTPVLADEESLAACALLAGVLGASVVVPPRSPTALARGRDRMLAAAARQREGIVAAEASALAEALDAAISESRPTARLTGLEPVPTGRAAAQRAAVGPIEEQELRSLVAVARRVAQDIVAVPAPASGLAAPRRRLLAEARALRRARRQSGLLSRLTSAVAPSGLAPAWRLAAAALAAVAGLAVGGSVLAPAAAAALPGDALYPVKLLGERMQLALAFDPEEQARVTAEHSRARGRELVALLERGRKAEIDDWRVAFKAIEERSQVTEPAHGVLLVTVPGENHSTVIWTLTWDQDTLFDLRGLYGAPLDLPQGAPLDVRVALAEDRDPQALAVALAADWPLQTATPAQPGTPTFTAQIPPTETQVATTTLTVEPPVQPATATDDRGAQPFASETADPILTGKPDRDRLRGVVEEVAVTEWKVRTDGEGRASAATGRLVQVDASRLPLAALETVRQGDWVQLLGRYVDQEHTVFQALALDRHVSGRAVPSQVVCTANSTVGLVADYVPVTSLTLTDGSRYDLSGLGVQVAPAGLQTGSRVRVEYKQCGDATRIATRVEVLDSPADTTLRGTVRNPSAGVFELVTRSGARYTVTYDAETVIAGAEAIEDGQSVQVRGWMESEATLHAVEIRVRDAASAPTAEGEAVASPEPDAGPDAADGAAGGSPAAGVSSEERKQGEGP